MRFEAFHLACFGRFTDRRLEFPHPGAQAADLHLVIGPNEAGKSTLRAAMVDFLFGIEARTPYAFRHDYRELLLGATLRRGDEIEQVERTKGNKNTLRRPDGEVLPEHHLAASLGTLDRASYLRDFALDHDALVAGSRQLLANRSDLSTLLFEAASGLAGFAAVRRRLEERAAELWTRDRRKRSRFGDVVKVLADAERARKEAVTTAADYERLRRAHQGAVEALEAARDRWRRLDLERADLERLRRVRPVFDRLARLEAELERIEAETRDEAGLLGEAVRIDAFAAEVIRTTNHVRDIGNRRIDIEHKERDAVAAAHAVGWDSCDRAAVEGRLPAEILRRELAALADARSALRERLDSRRESVQRLHEELASLRHRCDEIVEVSVDDALERVLARARREGDIAKRRDELADTLEPLQATWAARFSELAPWSGDAEALARMTPVDDADAEAAASERNRVATRLDAAKEALERLQRELAAKEAKLADRRRRHRLVERSELDAAREQRDDEWGRIRRGDVAIDEAAVSLEERVRVADDLADRRFESAETISRIEHEEAELAELQARFEFDSAQHAELVAAADRARGSWDERMSAIGLPGLTPDRYRGWLAARQRLLEFGAQRDRVAAELAGVEQRLQALNDALGEALGEDIGAAHAGSDIEARIERAEARRREAERSVEERKLRAAAVEEGERKLAEAQRALAATEAEWSQWSERFTHSVAACGLPAGIGVEAVRTALEKMAEIDAALAKIREIESERIARMEADLAAVKATAKELDGLLPDADRGGMPVEIAEALKARLDADRRRSERARDCVDQRRQAEDELVKASDGVEREALVAALRERDVAACQEREAVLADELADAAEQRDGAAAAEREARNALAAITGGDVDGSPAASAEEERQAAIAEMATIANEYHDTWLRARLLRWAIDLYRAEHQSPLLTRAAELFGVLTRGEYVGLVVDVDLEPPALVAKRGAERVGIDGLSDGTRDQLFFALRQSAIETQLAQISPLPVIADDLFVNFDDERAAAGFRALSALAQRTQVFYLSHHEHLIEVARNVLGKNLQVHHLPL